MYPAAGQGLEALAVTALPCVKRVLMTGSRRNAWNSHPQTVDVQCLLPVPMRSSERAVCWMFTKCWVMHSSESHTDFLFFLSELWQAIIRWTQNKNNSTRLWYSDLLGESLFNNQNLNWIYSSKKCLRAMHYSKWCTKYKVYLFAIEMELTVTNGDR